jgi:hypothetical protein
VKKVSEGIWNDESAALVPGDFSAEEALDIARGTFSMPADEPATVHAPRLWRIRPVNRGEGKEYELEWLEWEGPPGPGAFLARLVVFDGGHP